MTERGRERVVRDAQQPLRVALGRPTRRVLFGYIRPHRWVIVAGGVLSLLGGLAGLLQPLAAKALVDALGQHRGIAADLLFLSGLVLVGAAISALGGFLLERTAESVVLAARSQLVSRILWLRVAEVERLEPGDLLSRVTSDTTLLRQVTTQSMVSMITSAVTLVAVAVLMAFQDAVLLGVTAAVIVVVGVFVGLLMPRIARATRQAQESIGVMGATLERALGAFRTVKAAGAERREAGVVQDAAVGAWRAGVRAARWQSLVGASAGLTMQIAFLAVLGVGGAQVASGAITVSTLVAFLLFLFYLLQPVGQIVQAVGQLQVGAAAVARIEEVNRLDVEPDSPAGPPSEAHGPVEVRFEDVRFRYRADLPEVHRGISFEAPPGGITAFVGPSGAGKSTIFALIEHFYPATSGRVLVDGRDVADWPVADLRAVIGYVEQETPVLSGTLRENLVFAVADAADEEIRDVLVQTRLDGLVDRLPDGLQTVVGHRGSKLSGGERQRVAIARALLRRPGLLLLDEATSQLDAVNELALRQVVSEIARTTTVLVIAHRLSTVAVADRIVVLDGGVIRAIGTHAELVVADDLYAELAATQFLTAAP